MLGGITEVYIAMTAVPQHKPQHRDLILALRALLQTEPLQRQHFHMLTWMPYLAAPAKSFLVEGAL